MMSNVHQMPETIGVGEKFSIVPIFSNDLKKPIHFHSSDCGGRIPDVKLFKNVEFEDIVVCQTAQEITRGPHESKSVGSEILQFIALEPGQVNAQVVFDYNISESKIKTKPLIKTFSFEILPPQISH